MNKIKIDYTLLASLFIIIIFGLLNVYSASYNFPNSYISKQLIWLLFSCFVGLIFYFLGARRIINFSLLFYGFSMFLLIIVFFIPGDGVQRWIRLGFLSIQPSQIMKFSLPLFLVAVLNYYELNSSISLLAPIVITALPAILIAKEPDLGGALMLFPALIAFLILKKVSLRKAMPWIFCALIALPLLYFNLEDYQKMRLLTFANPNIDSLGAGYTLLQSKVAIGSGRILGKGWMKGVQGQLRFLPESHTDFVFPVFAEEWGFLGAMLLLLLYYILLKRMHAIAGRCKDAATRNLLHMYLVIISVQIIVNIGMTMGLFPVVGLPLPLFSYGGSDLIITIAIASLFLRASSEI